MQLPKLESKRKAVFLDKDGTLVTDVPYNVNPALVRLEKGVVEGLLALQSCGYLLVIVSNQPGISIGLFTKQALEKMIAHLINLFKKHGVTISGFYYCPHMPSDTNGNNVESCNCRKPRAGLLLNAATELNIDLPLSWMIGDILNDVEAGNRAGCKTILIDNGNETEWEISSNRIPDYVADDFLDGANYIFVKTMIKHA